jgi:hypothetical protein
MYTNTEIAALARAYMSATDNPLRGADQRLEDFVADFTKRMEQLAPAGLTVADGVSAWSGKSAGSSYASRKFTRLSLSILL